MYVFFSFHALLLVLILYFFVHCKMPTQPGVRFNYRGYTSGRRPKPTIPCVLAVSYWHNLTIKIPSGIMSQHPRPKIGIVWKGSHSSGEMQPTYSTAPTDWMGFQTKNKTYIFLRYICRIWFLDHRDVFLCMFTQFECSTISYIKACYYLFCEYNGLWEQI